VSLGRLAVLSALLMIAVGLALSNPTTDDYLRFVEEELTRALDRMDQNTSSKEQLFIRQVFKRQSGRLLESMVRPHTIRHNFGLLSKYDTDVMSTQVVVIGIAGRFIPIKGVEEATIKIGRMVF
jgi:hypothetical protein